MSRIATSIVRDAHAYTRSGSPWILDPCGVDRERAEEKPKLGRKLFHYLSGGGLHGCGRTVEQEEAEAKRTGFLVAFGALAILWLLLWF